MLLRNKKVVTRPIVIKENQNENIQCLKLFVLFSLGIMCYIYNYESPGVMNGSVLSVSKVVGNDTAIITVPAKVVPKPDILFFGSNEYLVYNLSNHKQVLQNILVNLDSLHNRTESMIFFAKNVAYMSRIEKNIMVLVYEFTGGRMMEPVVYYNRPTEEIVKVFVVW
jgi:hypothetical protein